MKNISIVRTISTSKDSNGEQYTIDFKVDHLTQEDVEYYAICDMIVKVQSPIRNLLANKTEKLPSWLKFDKASKTITATVEPKGTRGISENTLDKAASTFTKMNEDGKLFMLKKMFPNLDEATLRQMITPATTPES